MAAANSEHIIPYMKISGERQRLRNMKCEVINNGAMVFQSMQGYLGGNPRLTWEADKGLRARD